MVVGISNSFYVVFGPLLVSIENFIPIGKKIQKLKIFAIGRVWLIGPVGRKMVAATSNIQNLLAGLQMTFVPSLNFIGWNLAELAHCEIVGWLTGWAGLQLDSSKRSSYPIGKNADDDHDHDDTHQGWIILRDRKDSVADKKLTHSTRISSSVTCSSAAIGARGSRGSWVSMPVDTPSIERLVASDLENKTNFFLSDLPGSSRSLFVLLL